MFPQFASLVVHKINAIKNKSRYCMLLNIGIINLPPTTGSVPWRRRKTTLTFIKCVHMGCHFTMTFHERMNATRIPKALWS
jgi:hypothetical protein